MDLRGFVLVRTRCCAGAPKKGGKRQNGKRQNRRATVYMLPIQRSDGTEMQLKIEEFAYDDGTIADKLGIPHDGLGVAFMHCTNENGYRVTAFSLNDELRRVFSIWSGTGMGIDGTDLAQAIREDGKLKAEPLYRYVAVGWPDEWIPNLAA